MGRGKEERGKRKKGGKEGRECHSICAVIKKHSKCHQILVYFLLIIPTITASFAVCSISSLLLPSAMPPGFFPFVLFLRSPGSINRPTYFVLEYVHHPLCNKGIRNVSKRKVVYFQARCFSLRWTLKIKLLVGLQHQNHPFCYTLWLTNHSSDKLHLLSTCR